ncbi:hypothetical protein Pint_11203 [Pistacia integerrima]|uniref:Uncharacterized protein n=1 Tax=Pistacia integerrima TaxID=434235 RepID=A0ACC0XLT7_9ROSI|nr:hypothetical protein Pint_11203 [Pistacia integerrima]
MLIFIIRLRMSNSLRKTFLGILWFYALCLMLLKSWCCLLRYLGNQHLGMSFAMALSLLRMEKR